MKNQWNEILFIFTKNIQIYHVRPWVFSCSIKIIFHLLQNLKNVRALLICIKWWECYTKWQSWYIGTLPCWQKSSYVQLLKDFIIRYDISISNWTIRLKKYVLPYKVHEILTLNVGEMHFIERNHDWILNRRTCSPS